MTTPTDIELAFQDGCTGSPTETLDFSLNTTLDINMSAVRMEERNRRGNNNLPGLDQCNNAWLAMSENVSVGYTPLTTDIFVCRRHVRNVVPTRRRHSLVSPFFLAVGVVSARPVADTLSYMYIGISRVLVRG